MPDIPWTAEKLFKIADHHGISYRPEDVDIIEDSQILNFKNDYLEWAEERENSLLNYLSKTPNLFRSYLKQSRRVYTLALNVVWYLDEVIIRDQIHANLLFFKENDLENLKQAVKEHLQILNNFRKPIEQGYLLLKCVSSIALEPPSEMSEKLAQDISVFKKLCSLSSFGHVIRPDSLNRPVNMFQINLDTGNSFFMELQGAGTPGNPISVSSPSIKVGESFPTVTYEKLIKSKNINKDWLNKHILFPLKKEISLTLKAVEISNKLNAAVMYDRNMDEEILNAAKVELTTKHQSNTVGLFNLTLPFLNNIPPEHLVKLRIDMPDAFQDFRHKMVELKNMIIEKGIESPEEINEIISSKLNPQIRSLNSEITAEEKKANLLGYGGTITTGLGILAGSFFTVPPSVLLGLGITGTIGGLKVITDEETASERLKSHPLYFLWKAQRKPTS